MTQPQPKSVLLVDDEVQQARVLEMLMETRGYEVQTAFSGLEAFKLVSPQHDLIILDLVLPDIDGFEVCRRLKQDDHLKHIPVIILSAYSMSEDKVKSLYLGADDFLSKPCEHEELFARMDAALRRRAGEVGELEEKTVSELHRILEKRDVETYYQPIYRLQPFSLLGFEVLTRPVTSGHLKNPDRFFKLALHYGIYQEVELLAWSSAFAEISQKKYSGKIFLNCSPYFVEAVDFNRVKMLLNYFRIEASRIVLEITEMSAIPDFRLFYEKLKPYKDYGFSFAIDDLGRGYASLESLIEIHPQFVKIDGYIVRDLCRDDLKRSIVEFVAGFCRKHGMLVVGEGVESQGDLDAIRNMGLDAGQGYLFCKPQKELNIESFSNLAKCAQFQSSGNFFSI